MMNYTTVTEIGHNGEKRHLTLPIWPNDIFAYDPMADLAELIELHKGGATLFDRLAHEMPTTWDALTGEISDLFERMHRLASPFGNLAAAMQTEAILAAEDHFTQASTEFSNIWNFHDGLYRAFSAYRGGEEYPTLDDERKRYIDLNILDWELAGLMLPEEKRARLKAIALEFAPLSDKFKNNVNDAEKNWTFHVVPEHKDRLRGIPSTIVETMRLEAESRGLSGWVAMIKSSIAIPILEYAEDRDLRRIVYEARVARAGAYGPDAGKYDNRPTALEQLRLRQEEALILGKRNYADVSLAKKMASSPEEVITFLRAIAQKAKPIALSEVAESMAFARDELGIATPERWDIAYIEEKLREKRYHFSREELRPYLSAAKALEGVFAVATRLHGWTFVREDVSVWHESVKFFKCYDRMGALIGGLYVDIYARVGDKVAKSPGAWADGAMYRRLLPDGVQLPVAYLHATFAPPEEGGDGKISHDDLVTLFHEFGHDAHHLAGLSTTQDTSWGGVEWDAIELPSQRNEAYAWLPEILLTYSAHEKTGEPIPQELIDKLLASRFFHEAWTVMAYLDFGMADILLHTPQGEIGDDFIDTQVRASQAEMRLLPKHPNDSFPNAFTHIFAGGYAAGYYSYHWADTLVGGSNAEFEKAGGLFDQGVAARYTHEVLEASGKRSMRESVLAFCGHIPDVNAFLKNHGLPI